MKKLLWYTLNLQQFASEGEGVEGEVTGGNNAVAEQNGTDNPESEFSALINGKFKDEFTKKTQAIIDKRFKTTKELEEYKNRVSPVVEKLMEKYGLESGREEALSELLFENDDEFEHKGKESADDFSRNLTENGLKSRIVSWLSEGEAFKTENPDFDLRSELRENKLFSRLLLSGVPLKTAYEVIHKDEYIRDAMHYTADTVRKQMVQSIEAKGRRPVENGISSESAIVTSVDVNSLTSQDILKIIKQVENGANIKF